MLRFHLNKVVWEEAPLPVQVSLHPAVLLDVPHVLDDVTRPQRQLVIVERLVLVLHQDLCSEEEGGMGGQRETMISKNGPEVVREWENKETGKDGDRKGKR